MQETKDLKYISNNKTLKKECTEDLKYCLLALLDGRQNKNSIKEFDKHIEILESVANNKVGNRYEYAWVNATCQVNFAAHFNAQPDNLPGVVALLPQVKKYAVMYGSFEKDNINYFIDSVLNGKIPLEEFNNEKIYLKNAINCEEIFDEEEFVSDNQDDEIIKEIMDEAITKREEFEEEREKILKEDKKNKKKKKKDDL